MKLKPIQKSIERSTKEIITLMKQILKHKPTSRIDFRQMLLLPETQYHKTTIRLLKLDQEFNLVQYHGLQKYITNHSTKLLPSFSSMSSMSFSSLFSNWRSSNTSESPTTSSTTTNTTIKNHNEVNTTNTHKNHCDSNSNSNSNSNSSTKAKVAFMITAQQRRILMSEYNYTQQEIKSMKPNEAQIILHHSIQATATATATTPLSSSNAVGDNGEDDTNNTHDNGWRVIVKELIEKEKQQQQQQQQQYDMEDEFQTQKKQESIEKDEKKIHTSNTNNEKKVLRQEQQLNNDILSIGFEERLPGDGHENLTNSNTKSLSLIPDKSKNDGTTTTTIGDETQYEGNKYYHIDHENIDNEQQPTMLLLDDNGTSTKTAAQNKTNNDEYDNEESIRNNEIKHQQQKKQQQQEQEKEIKHGDSDKVWYEVITSSALEGDMPIALCKSLEEAQEFLNIKQDLAEKRSKSGSSTSMTPSPKEILSIRKKTV